MRSIPIAKPIIYEEEIRAVEEVLRAGMLSEAAFEKWYERVEDFVRRLEGMRKK